jgi:hypothetical protein
MISLGLNNNQTIFLGLKGSFKLDKGIKLQELFHTGNLGNFDLR